MEVPISELFTLNSSNFGIESINAVTFRHTHSFDSDQSWFIEICDSQRHMIPHSIEVFDDIIFIRFEVFFITGEYCSVHEHPSMGTLVRFSESNFNLLIQTKSNVKFHQMHFGAYALHIGFEFLLQK